MKHCFFKTMKEPSPWNIAYQIQYHYGQQSFHRVLCVLQTFSFIYLVLHFETFSFFNLVLYFFVDEEVHGGEEEEGDDPCADKPGPVDVVHDVGGIQSWERLIWMKLLMKHIKIPLERTPHNPKTKLVSSNQPDLKLVISKSISS